MNKILSKIVLFPAVQIKKDLLVFHFAFIPDLLFTGIKGRNLGHNLKIFRFEINLFFYGLRLCSFIQLKILRTYLFILDLLY